MDIDKLKEMQADAMKRLMKSRSGDGMWRGELSSSAISTSVSVFALQRIDSEKYSREIENGVCWLHKTMKADGSWGDSVESPSNMTATLLTYVSLFAVGQAPQQARAYFNDKFGGDSEEALIKGVLNYYGKDLTFSVPILMMCALAGVIKSWKKIPPFPFELATLPQSLFRYLNLPVVSYAIPALIAIGICQMKRRGGMLSPLRKLFIPKAMRILTKMQPEDGGYLEAAPLTAFVSMCLAEACKEGEKSEFIGHEVTQKCAKFLVDTVREDGSWPIDTNLSGWVTSLAGKVIAPLKPERGTAPLNLERGTAPLTPEGEKECQERGRLAFDVGKLADIIKKNATTEVHPFTAAMAGGWGWSDLSGSVPDGDDTSGALVALHHLTQGTLSQEVENGLRWLMWLQNNDGGMPTFCKGWGKLPFDRSTPDITAHAILAMGLWLPTLQGELKKMVQKSFDRMIEWMEKQSSHSVSGNNGAWIPLWFGDQDAADEKAPVYGTATAIDYLMSTHHPSAIKLAMKQIDFILHTQNEDGGWGGNKGVRSKVTYTSRALAALEHFSGHYEEAKDRGWQYLYGRFQVGTLYEREPIGLYFSRLWYSEEMYNVTFLLRALQVYNEKNITE